MKRNEESKINEKYMSNGVHKSTEHKETLSEDKAGVPITAADETFTLDEGDAGNS
eukprot:CAMPEP_0173414064 /NCGR_PEP_ID=MMETSP1356-20130122/83561_1 /TAXON_ID=77927 ORGANISM="Hemiselmis virescens, Strain PCC157" /NCGR_SAMPLE_ID=MMETSP1356 /ASSEMBLY_ACC=CAM_ASM_000847 /LENGTH=54 /DNA_ID=CAMNT_0014376181 /DNA_START=1 /DNA_END=162 /DNA_ORIENTATION=-